MSCLPRRKPTAVLGKLKGQGEERSSLKRKLPSEITRLLYDALYQRSSLREPLEKDFMKPQLKTSLAALNLTIISYIYTVTVSILVGSRRFLSALFGSFPPVRLTFPHWNVTKMVPDLIIGDSFVFHWPAKCKMQNAFLCIFKHTSVPQLKHFNVLLVIHQRTIGYSSWCADFLPILFDSSIFRFFVSLVLWFFDSLAFPLSLVLDSRFLFLRLDSSALWLFIGYYQISSVSFTSHVL